MAKHGLGKGIAALLPDDDSFAEAAPAQVKDAGAQSGRIQAEMYVPIEKLKANPLQPRKDFNDDELAELADSIKEHGIIQPVIVEENNDDTDAAYIIVAGERRIRAAKIAGLAQVPIIVRKYSEDKRMAVSLIENIQRSNLNPIEEAMAYKHLMELSGISQDEAAARVGKNRTTVANAIRLLKLPFEMQESIRKGNLSAGHARAILSLTNAKAQNDLYMEILKKGLSVRDAEKLAAALNDQSDNHKNTKKTSAKPAGRPPELADMEDKFLNRLGTKVKITGDLKGGTIVIDYYSMEDLDRLYEIMLG